MDTSFPVPLIDTIQQDRQKHRFKVKYHGFFFFFFFFWNVEDGGYPLSL